jgi:phage tail-like protein
LIQSPPGRYPRLRVTLQSAGPQTPSIRAIRVFYPRNSYLDLLPRVYRRDADSARFLEHFLALFEGVFTRIGNDYEAFSRALNLDAAQLDVINWLGCLVDLTFDPSWSLEKRRSLVGAAMDLYRRRGTVEGLARYIEIYTGIRPIIRESFLLRPTTPALLGSRGCILGCSFALRPAVPDTRPEEQLYYDYAHRFTVYLFLDDRCDRAVVEAVVDRIVEVNKPAHTGHGICSVFPEARVGLQATLGIDLVLGGRGPPHTQLGGKPQADAPATGVAALGVDSILGERRPQYQRPRLPEL